MTGAFLDSTHSTTILAVSILHFNTEDHHFSPNIKVSVHAHVPGQESSTEPNATYYDWKPSESWMRRYREWNDFNGIPHFDNPFELQAFNDKGKRLAEALREEVASQNNASFNIVVRSFVPLYSGIEVGSVSSWWHIRDANYRGLIIPVQHLPVSDDLKMRIQAWRMRIGHDSFRKELRIAFNEQGRSLEQDILAELSCSCKKHPGESVPPKKCCPKDSFSTDSESTDASITEWVDPLQHASQTC